VGVDPLGHVGRLEAGRPASPRPGIVQGDRRQIRGQSAPPGVLERLHVVDPAVGAEIERQRDGDVLAVEAPDQNVERRRIGPGQEARREPAGAQVLRPVRPRELDLRARQADVVERHAHGTGRLLDRVAPPFEIALHGHVGLVSPGGKAGDAGRRVGGLHRLDGAGALGGREVALEKRVVVDGALGPVREDGGGDAGQAVDRGARRPAGVLLPGREQGLDPAGVEVGIGQRCHLTQSDHVVIPASGRGGPSSIARYSSMWSSGSRK
jgi:hypothetical protein